MKRCSSILVFLTSLFASALGQHTIVQTLTYDSTSRTMMVDFPEGDHLNYEKIRMHYSMRCKDGLVSTGSDRNRGCGEWDYSCNTFITDSTRVDSFQASAPSHVIQGYDESTFEYSIDTTFIYYQSTLQQVTYTGTANEVLLNYDAGNEMMPFPLGTDAKERKTQFLYRRLDLINNGVSAGLISGLKLHVASGTGSFPRLRIRMMQTDVNELDGYTLNDENLVEVFYDDVTISSAEPFFKFYRDFSWDGISNVLVEFSYSSATNTSLLFEGGATNYAAALTCDGSANLSFHSEGEGSLEIDSLNYTGDEISISFWYLGSESQPRNSTVFEGVDDQNQRQVNVHLPWGDGNVYWDCGNDGNGYDRVAKSAQEFDEVKKWNHWTFTKNANTGFMRIYLNGEPWSIGLNKRKSITISSIRIGSSHNQVRYSFGQFDNFQIYDKELTADEIKSIMSRKNNAGQLLYDHLVLDYDFNQVANGVVVDNSTGMRHTQIEGRAYGKKNLGRFLRSEAEILEQVPDLTFVRGTYTREITEEIVLDQLENSPYTVIEYAVVNNDLVQISEHLYYLSGIAPVYDENGDLVDAIFLNSDGTINIEELIYFTRRPSKYELVSFVTPYGIGIDFGLEGKTWIFDVTDFGPILKGRKKLSLEFGGQFQEEMDIKFEFIEGTPPRDVLNIQQVWPVTSEAYGRIINDFRFEERRTKLSADAASYALKAAISGHGIEGEFIPRVHYLNVDGGERELEWSVWKECSINPIYPQGGTWIYDRAGWCPGEPTDVQVLPLEGVTPGSDITLDYGLNTAIDDSRYIVNIQLISYGDANFNQDAEIVEIINPSPRPEFERFNPMCGVPTIKIRNTGKNVLRSAEITYGVVNHHPRTFNWTGELDFMEEEIVELWPIYLDQSVSDQEFYARISKPNNGVDQYPNNNEKRSVIPFIPSHGKDIIIEFRTNGAANETSWQLLDENATVIKSRGGGLLPNTLYRDTIKNMNGCYRFRVMDTDDDGLSWWHASTDGTGSIQIRDLQGGVTLFETEFGRFLQYEFVTDGYVQTTEYNETDLDIVVFPNPAKDQFTLSIPEAESIQSIQIFSPGGEQLTAFKAKISNRSIEINLEDYPVGLYLIQITMLDRVVVKRVIKS